MTAEAHHDALMARLRAHAKLVSSVFDLGKVPTTDPPNRYAVVASSPGDREQSRVTSRKIGRRTSHVVYCVGFNNSAALKVATWVEEQMLNHRLVVADRNVFAPDPWITREVQIDKDGPIVWPFATIAFDILSEPG